MENLDPHDSQNKDRQMARFFILDLGEGGWGFAVKFHSVQDCSLNPPQTSRILWIICPLGITISVLHYSGLTGFLKPSYRETPSMDLSQVQTVPWNLNPGLQGIAVTLKKYLFFNVEKISSTWKRCSVLLVSCLYTVLLARRYENGKDTSLSGDNRRIFSSTCSLLLRPGLSVWDIVAMVNTMWLSSSNPWISIMDFSPGDSCRVKQKKKKKRQL